MKETCIFFQAPAELSYVIQLYDEYKDKAKITIVVVNVYSNYEFIKSLNLTGATIFFCETPVIKRNILTIPSIRKSIGYFGELHFASFTEGDVFFFSASFDWISAYFIKRFCSIKRIKVHYAGFNTTEIVLKEAYKEGEINKGLSLKNYIYILLLKLITGIWFDFYKRFNCIAFPYFKYGIKHEPIQLRTDCIEPYKYEIPGNDYKNVLLFTTTWAYEGEEIKSLVDEKICEIIKEIQNWGYRVVAKGHPRLGLAKNIEKIVDCVLPNHVPAEFIDVSRVKMIIGLNSAAIIHYAKYSNVEVVSLLKMLDGISPRLVCDNIKLMQKMSGEKIKTPHSLQEFCTLIVN